jgi:hypothetical protein
MKRQWIISGYYPGISLEELRKDMKDPSRVSRALKYMSEASVDLEYNVHISLYLYISILKNVIMKSEVVNL